LYAAPNFPSQGPHSADTMLSGAPKQRRSRAPRSWGDPGHATHRHQGGVVRSRAGSGRADRRLPEGGMTQTERPGGASKSARSLSGWVGRPRPAVDAATSASKQEAHREQAPRQVRQRRPAFHGRFDRNKEAQAGPDLSPAALPSDDGSRLRRKDQVLANGL